MIGTIGVEGLEISCVIGCQPEERRRPRRLLVDVEADVDISAASASDDLADAIDYRELATTLDGLARERRFSLLEAFAAEGTALLLERWPALQRVGLTVRKPGAVPGAVCSLVRLERQREP
jgi:7,8-dihydroneopterin aldolase/epimerase/oxygenase